MTHLRRFAFGLVLLLCAPLTYAQSSVIETQLIFTTIDVPGAAVTGVYGINAAGEMVGYYGPDNGGGTDRHGFLYNSGTFTYLDYPGATSTFAFGINDSGLIAGSAEFQGGSTGGGFLYDGATYTLIKMPGKPVTYFWAINNVGQVVGSAGNSGGDFRGFMIRNGRFRPFNFPGQYGIGNPTGINDFGLVAGYTINAPIPYRTFTKAESLGP